MFKSLWRHFVKTISNERGDFGSSKERKAAETGITQAGETMYERGKLQYGEETQYPESFKLGEIYKQILLSQMGLGQAPSGYQGYEQQYQQQGDLAKTLYGTTLADVQDPYASYESTFQPQLQSAEDYINRQAAERGLLRSGVPIEQMGRAGAEIAVKEAAARMTYRQQALSNASNLSQNIYSQGQQNLSNLYGLYGTQQQAGLTAMSRQASQAQAAAQYSAYPYQYALGNSGGSMGGMGTALGAGLGALLALPTGGLSVLGGGLLGGTIGGGLGSSIK